jgi:hypothetical protein
LRRRRRQAVKGRRMRETKRINAVPDHNSMYEMLKQAVR